MSFGAIIIGSLNLSVCSEGTRFAIRYSKPEAKTLKSVIELIPKQTEGIEIIYNSDDYVLITELVFLLMKEGYFVRLKQIINNKKGKG